MAASRRRPSAPPLTPRSEESAPLAVTASLDLKQMVLFLVLYMVDGDDLHTRVCVRGDLVRAGLLPLLEILESTCLQDLRGTLPEHEEHVMISIVDTVGATGVVVVWWWWWCGGGGVWWCVRPAAPYSCACCHCGVWGPTVAWLARLMCCPSCGTHACHHCAAKSQHVTCG
jgi:hypothetical protein